MHILRLKRAEGDLVGVSAASAVSSGNGDDFTSSQHQLSGSHTRSYLDQDSALEGVSAPFTVVHSDGTLSTQSPTFLERLVPSTPMPSGAGGDRPSTSSVSVNSHTLRKVPQLVRTHSAVVALQKSVSKLNVSDARTAPSVDDDVDDDDRTDDESGASSDETFFKRVQREFKSLKSINPSDLRLAEEGAAQLREAEDIASGLRFSAGVLHPLIRVDASKRDTVNQLFSDLQRPVVRDAVRSDAIRRLEIQQRKYHKQIDTIVDPACSLLEAVWEQHVVPQAHRKRFAERFFTSPSLESFTAINVELRRYQNVATTETDLIRYVGLRETYIAHLKKLLAHPQLLSLAVESFVAEGLVADVFSTILLIRHVTCEIIDNVEKRRQAAFFQDDADNSSTVPKNRSSAGRSNKMSDATSSSPDDPVGLPLLYNGSNYLVRMQSDMDFLASSKLAVLLESAYALTGNPLILPTTVQSVRTGMVQELKHRKTSLRDTIHNSREKVLEEEYWREQREQASVASAAQHTDEMGDSVTSKHRPPRQGAPPLGKKNDGGRSASTASSSPIVCIPEGVDLLAGRTSGSAPSAAQTPQGAILRVGNPAATPASTNISSGKPASRIGTPALTFLAPDDHPRGTVVGSGSATPGGPDSEIIAIAWGDKPEAVGDRAPSTSTRNPPSTASQTREAFFRKIQKAELMKSRRIPMDRSNVYQYPASVYKEKPVPVWSFLGHVLQRSLDPRVAAETYVDKIDFERMQYGNVAIPPAFYGKQTDPVINLETQVFRSVLTELPSRGYAALVQRDVVLFTEEAFLERAALRKRFHRAVDRLKLAYRGFVLTLHRYQAIRDPRRNVVQDFLGWVGRYAPLWLVEAKASLQNSDDDGLINALR